MWPRPSCGPGLWGKSFLRRRARWEAIATAIIAMGVVIADAALLFGRCIPGPSRPLCSAPVMFINRLEGQGSKADGRRSRSKRSTNPSGRFHAVKGLRASRWRTANSLCLLGPLRLRQKTTNVGGMIAGVRTARRPAPFGSGGERG